jgi:hypothetical protein
MVIRIDLNEGANRDLAERIVTRMMDQGESEVRHVLTQLFSNSPTMRINSMANDFGSGRDAAKIEIMNSFESEVIDLEIFNILSSADRDHTMILSRSNFDPTKFELSITCARTPFKELFDECKEITCEKCIKNRVLEFNTSDKFSKSPWLVNIERVEKRRVDICKQCGQMLGKKDNINMQNERLLYTCSYCGHKGWTKAK